MKTFSIQFSFLQLFSFLLQVLFEICTGEKASDEKREPRKYLVTIEGLCILVSIIYEPLV